MGTPAERIKTPPGGLESEEVLEPDKTAGEAQPEQGREATKEGSEAAPTPTVEQSGAADQQPSSWSAASVLTEAGQCIDEMFRTAVLCFYEPAPEGQDDNEEAERRRRKQEQEQERRRKEQAEKEEAEGPGFVVKVGQTVLSAPRPGPAGGSGGGMAGSAMAVDFGDVPVGKTAKAVVCVENRRHPFVDYSVRCSFAPVTNCKLRVDGGRPFPGYAVQGALRKGEKREVDVEASPSKPGPTDEGAMTVTVAGTVHELVLRATGVDTRNK